MTADAPVIDELDRSIVERLRRDGRETNRSLATALGVNEATIAARLRRLETNNVMHVVALTDMYGLGFQEFAIGMVTTQDRPVAEVAAEIAAVPETIFVNLHTGRYDVTCGVLVRDRAELGRVVGEAIPRIRGVASVRCELAVDVTRFDSAWAALGVGGDLARQPRPVVPPEALDELDLGIIAALQRDARISNRSVAAELDISEGTVRARLRRMEEENLIRIRAVSDIGAFGISAAAVVGVHVAGGKIAAAQKRLEKQDRVAAIIRSVGEFDFVVIMFAEDRPALLDAILNEVQAIAAVRSTETFEVAGVLKHVYTWVRLVD
jgi:DNA-binding Lrp family transcriptional regulator